jgi:predicted TIM-barrel fold metal-dependent hydrolase
MRAIDIHTHVFPDDVAPRAMAALEEEARVNAAIGGSVGDLRRSMAEAEVVASVVAPVSTKPTQVAGVNRWVRSLAASDVIPFGTLYPLSPTVMADADALIALGLRGVKLHPDYQRFHPDDPRVFPMYERLEAAGVIALFHAGIDIGLYPPVYGTPRRIAEVLYAFPRLKIIAAHMGGYQMWDEVEQHLLGQDLYFDTSFCSGVLSETQWISLMERHGWDRVLFGTDSPWRAQRTEREIIERLPIPGDAKEAVLYDNAARLLGLE